MPGLWRKNRPTFFWQGLLIVLPVVLLVGIGLVSLRRDKALALQEGTERAQALADSVSRRLWDSLTRLDPALAGSPITANVAVGDSLCQFQVDNQGNLLFPPPNDVAPAPKPFDLTELNERQAELWRAARKVEFSRVSGTNQAAIWEEFLQTKPPPDFTAASQFALGLAFASRTNLAEADRAFMQVCDAYPGASAESGLPFKVLAQIQRLRLRVRPRDHSIATNPALATMENISLGTNSSTSTIPTDENLNADAICADAIRHPSALTPLILSLADQGQARGTNTPSPHSWRALWENHELARKLHRAVIGQPKSDHPWGQVGWLTLGSPRLNVPVQDPAGSSSNQWVVCRTETEVRRLVRAALDDAGPIPDYLGTTIELAGRPVLSTLNQTTAASGSLNAPRIASSRLGGIAGTTPDLLATASKTDGPLVQLKVSLHLSNPTLFYARQRSRTLSYGLLIGAAAAAALVGWLAAWRSFRRQLRLSELKSNFVSSVSHELRAPISSVRLLAERLDRGRVKTEEKKKEYFRFIVQECRRLSSLIENVLDFARIEQGRRAYEMEPTDVCELVRQTVKLMEPYAAERQIALVTELPDLKANNRAADSGSSIPGVCIDGRAIQQVLLNLVDNALKHSPVGSTVTVGLEVSGAEDSLPPQASGSPPPNPGWVRFWVEDHGEGIPPSEHERIFERFYRRGSELRRETQGVGIGLSIVKHVIEAHGGRVIVRSAVGQGSRFTVELPRNSKPTSLLWLAS